MTLTRTSTPTLTTDPGPDQVRTVDANERVLPSAHVDWTFKAEAATGTAPWVPAAVGTSGNGGAGGTGSLRKKAPAKKGDATSAGLVRWKTKADGKGALRQAGVLDANPRQLSP